MKKVKFSNLAGNKESNFLSENKVALKAEELALLLGGSGCESRICEDKRDVGVIKFCSGCGACVSGVGSCTGKTDGITQALPPTPTIGTAVTGPITVSSGTCIVKES